MSYNALTVQLYARGSTTLIADQHDELSRVSEITFSTQSPGGLYSECTFYVPMSDVTGWWIWQGGQRLVVRNGIEIVWEGYIQQPGRVLNELDQGAQITAIGAWGDILMRQYVNKCWRDARVDARTWEDQISEDMDDFRIQRLDNTIHQTPEDSTYASGDYCAARYVMPTGQTIKRISYFCDYILSSKFSAYR